MFEVTINRVRRTIIFRASGIVTPDEVDQMHREAIWATDSFRGEPHIVLADMRGMVPMSPEAAGKLGAIIRYGREHGTAWCVHLSDSSIQKLQTARVTREVSKDDEVTIDVVSIEEAERVITEKQGQLLLKKKR